MAPEIMGIQPLAGDTNESGSQNSSLVTVEESFVPRLTKETDVYAFAVLALEVSPLTGFLRLAGLSAKSLCALTIHYVPHRLSPVKRLTIISRPMQYSKRTSYEASVHGEKNTLHQH